MSFNKSKFCYLFGDPLFSWDSSIALLIKISAFLKIASLLVVVDMVCIHELEKDGDMNIKNKEGIREETG
jgi:hypothetical protein